MTTSFIPGISHTVKAQGNHRRNSIGKSAKRINGVYCLRENVPAGGIRQYPAAIPFFLESLAANFSDQISRRRIVSSLHLPHTTPPSFTTAWITAATRLMSKTMFHVNSEVNLINGSKGSDL